MSSSTFKLNGVTISEGNRKLGAIPSVSLLPQLSCGKHCGCQLLCMKDCYAMKMQGYTSVAPSWKRNFEVWSSSQFGFHEALWTYLRKRQPERFRWQVGGDIPDQQYLDTMIQMAKDFPKTRFRAFTKAYDLVPLEHPRLPNLRIGISHWPGMDNPRIAQLRGYTHSWLVPKRKTVEGMLRSSDAVPCMRPSTPTAKLASQFLGYKIPRTARPCPGSCEKCSCCWTMRGGQHVKFEQH